ncbi:MAG TPA: hypothetical protein VJ436_14260 [Anaerolineales bacterium]|nr:hypothetical protein [Anaerolineales bacterium]
MSTKTAQSSNSQSFSQMGHSGENSVSFLAEEYVQWQTLFQTQPTLIQRFLEAQARSLAEGLIQSTSQARFMLPNRVVVVDGEKSGILIPADQREQLVGGLVERLTRTRLKDALRQRLDELEVSSDPAMVASAGLLRFATATALVHELLPAGRSVRYRAAEGEEIPTLPIIEEGEIDSAITATTDAITEEEDRLLEEGRGELLVPYVPAARRFFLPQWVAFGDQDLLLVKSTVEAEAHIASMQRFVRILHLAVALAPYMVADGEYQQKRYGMLGQLINQGRALARFQTREIIATIKRRTAASDLNRGLSISLPYFDDQTLEMKTNYFDVIPAGRIMFVPGFIVLAARKELAKVEQDTRLDRSTRKHLLAELRMLETAFLPAGQNH